MGAGAFHPHPGLSFPTSWGFNNQLKLGKPICSIRDRPLAFASWKDVLQSGYSGTDSDGNSIDRRHPKKSSAPRRTRKSDENKKSRFSDGKPPKSSSQEEILALFRRIQSSISKEESVNRNKRNSKLVEDNSPAESILEVLRQPGKQAKGTTKVREASKVKARQRAMHNSGQMPQNYAQLSADKKLTRPPSNFVKRTPIPSRSNPRGIVAQINSELSATTSISPALESPKLVEMKLPELKELAKSRGIRGYSKLKKGELLELLRSSNKFS